MINFSINKNSIVSIKVYDILGKEIATLIDGYMNTGCYSVTLRTKNYNLPSGFYFYTLQNGEVSITKKMLVLK